MPAARNTSRPSPQRGRNQFIAPLYVSSDGKYTVHIPQSKNRTWIVFVVLASALATALLSVGAALLISYFESGSRPLGTSPLIISVGADNAKVMTDNDYVTITFTGESFHFENGKDFPVNIESKHESSIWLSLTEVRINGSNSSKVEINNDDIIPFTISEAFIHIEAVSDLTELIEFSATLNVYDCETLKKIDSIPIHYSYRLLV